ncbi:MAG: FAD-binding oxidoreductase [Betaproteobacteria bacterium]|nr:FAD-binding oxidoreductase [Betaproteobacteria bacterium]MDH3435941.1 FAD-binding oxidoreductase [Betaproteobacteria bacterium]
MPKSAHSTLSGRASTLERIRAVVGIQGILTDAGDIEPYVVDWRGFYRGQTPAVVRPASTAEVAAVVKICAETHIPVVPQGGNTGMCGAATPSPTGDQIILSLGRMNRVREVDALNDTLTADAGCILANIQQAALNVDRLFPLSLGAEGSCQIGGNLATNAGGVNVLRYGNARDLTLGLEVVLPDGRVWNGLRGLRKDNTGYDLKDVFVGSEGTLGIITAAVLKLFPRPRTVVTAMAAVPDPAAAVALLGLLRGECGECISAFELISRLCLDLVFNHIPDTRDPFSGPHSWYVLTELADANEQGPLRAAFERAMALAVERGLVVDAVIAGGESQRQSLWRMRESIPEASRAEGMLYRHDISVSVSRIADFISTAEAALERAFPDVRIICFGHLGDGNLHYNAFVAGRRRDNPADRDATDVNRIVYDVVHRFGGSFSAEHGIGQSKRGELALYKSAVELELMRTLKRALDPHNIMNPGKVLPDSVHD